MTQSDRALEILRAAAGPVPVSDLKAAGVSPETLRRMVEAGTAERPAAGHYALAGRVSVADLDWVAFALQVPEGVIGLLTAAVHHGMTQEMPAHMQAFVPRNRSGGIRLGGDSSAYVDTVAPRNPLYLEEGIETVVLSGTAVRVTGRERTLVDLFQFSPFSGRTTERNARVPEESFLESLSRCVADPGFSFDAVHDIAAAFGCEERLRPFTKTSRYDAPRQPGF